MPAIGSIALLGLVVLWGAEVEGFDPLPPSGVELDVLGSGETDALTSGLGDGEVGPIGTGVGVGVGSIAGTGVGVAVGSGVGVASGARTSTLELVVLELVWLVSLL